MDAIIISYKNKLDKSSCGESNGLLLLAAAGKFLASHAKKIGGEPNRISVAVWLSKKIC